MKFVNLCPHEIKLNNGQVFPPSGQVARVKTSYTTPDPITNICGVTFGKVEGLPPQEDDTFYIVSGLVWNTPECEFRPDVISPATGHPDCIRVNGQVHSVPCFVK